MIAIPPNNPAYLESSGVAVNAHSFNDATSGINLQVLTTFRNAAMNASQDTSTSRLSLQCIGHQFNPHLLNRFADVE